MRDIVLATIIFGSLPIILCRPWVGIIMWNWISFMNPHRLSWGFMYDLPIAAVIGGMTLIAWTISDEDRKIPWNAIAVLLAVYLGWCTITTFFAINPDDAWDKWKQFTKSMLMIFVALSLIKKELHFRTLVWTTVVSVGFFSFKGGIFTVLTGGNFEVYGPPNTNIADNNGLAAATLMIIPLMIYLAQTTDKKWVRLGLYTATLFSFISVVGSYSRGAFLGMAAIAIVLWWRSDRKIIIGITMAVLVAGSMSVIPQKWFDRIDTIQNYDEDGSATGRLDVWEHAVRVAKENPVLGGGFHVFYHEPTFKSLSPDIRPRAVHSIYFEALGENGYIGLALFLVLGIAGLVGASRIKKICAKRPGFENEYKFGNLIFISFIAYAVGGAFLNLGTFDLYYTLLAFVVIQHHLIKVKLENKLGVPDLQKSAPGKVLGGWTKPVGRPARSFLRAPSN